MNPTCTAGSTDGPADTPPVKVVSAGPFSLSAMARAQPAPEESAEIIDVAELLNADATYADGEPSAVPDTPEGREHGLFLERLDELMREQLDAVRAFAEREGKPLDYIRRHVAHIHAKFLFDKTVPDDVHAMVDNAQAPITSVRTIVSQVCHTLDSLRTVGKYESLVLVTSSRDIDKSYIGGSKAGKSFWDSLKMGGSNGIKMFKNHCKSHAAAREVEPTPSGSGKKCKNSLKSELNTAMRVALRIASGNSSAEMRWTKPEQIENWGVRIVGWPSDLPFRNPSNNTVQVNTRLLELLKTGQIRFVKPTDPEWEAAAVAPQPKPTKPPSDGAQPPPQQPQEHEQVQQQQQMQSTVMIPPGVVLHAGGMDHVELLRHGTAIFHTLPGGVISPEALRQGYVTVPVSVALPVMQQQPGAHIEPVDHEAWVQAQVQAADAQAAAQTLKRKREDGDDGTGPEPPEHPRSPESSASPSPGPIDVTAS